MNDFGAIGRFGLLLVRPGMLVIGTPFLGAVYAPAPLRIGLTLVLALVLAPVVATPALSDQLSLTLVVAREVAIGAALALAVRILTAGAELAGELVGYQAGLSYGAIVDPQSGVRNTSIALLYSSMTIVLCFAINAHHSWLRALAASYVALPIGVGAIGQALVPTVAQMLGLVFILGVRLAAPVVAVLLLVEFVLGLMTRVAPSLNLMVVGAPVRVPIALLVVGATVAALPGLMTRFVPAAFEVAVAAARAFR